MLSTISVPPGIVCFALWPPIDLLLLSSIERVQWVSCYLLLLIGLITMFLKCFHVFLCIHPLVQCGLWVGCLTTQVIGVVIDRFILEYDLISSNSSLCFRYIDFIHHLSAHSLDILQRVCSSITLTPQLLTQLRLRVKSKVLALKFVCTFFLTCLRLRVKSEVLALNSCVLSSLMRWATGTDPLALSWPSLCW